MRRSGSAVLGKFGYVVVCLAAVIVLVASGYAHSLVGATTGLEGGANLGGGVSPTGALNILLMGLESRTNFQGQNLSAAQLTQTHSGNAASVAAGIEGSQDTDTLILVHVFAGGEHATGFSIPRDDVVNFPHSVTVNGAVITEGKIDAAYLYAYDQYISQNVGTMGTTPALYAGANQAGQLFEVQTVEQVTGVHIDHFVVSNIEGFFQIAQQIGGINACIAPAPASIEPGGLGFKTGSNLVDLPSAGAPLSASNSGFDAFNDGYNEAKRGAQYIHLQPAQALAFVRARDSLPGVDIGRTARQQAAIDYIIYDFKHRNVLTDPGLISSMLNNAKSYLQTDQGFDLLSFAPQMQSLTGAHLKMTTLPDAAVQNITIPGYPSAQDANYIYVPKLQQMVNSAFYGSAAVAASKSVTVDVYNGSGASGLAASASQAIAALGYTAGKTADASAQSQQLQSDTQVFYGAGAENNAESIADMVGAMAPTSLSSLPAGHVEVLLGQQVISLPAGLETFGASTVTEQEFVAAGQQDNLPASELPPTGTAGRTAATQSVSATEIGGPAAASAQPTASGQSELAQLTAVMQLAASAGTTTSSSYNGPRPADVPAGIPCVY
jgi:anionic cell wall polymer biosynthesis LytR-Cps2A-Psr (LCP) family protein